MKIKCILLYLIILTIILSGCSQIKNEDDKWSWAPGKGPTATTLEDVIILIDDTTTTETETTTTLAVTATTMADTSGLQRKEYNEGDLVSFPNLAKTDADGDQISYTFTSPLDENGEWQTKAGDAGEYKLTITASDGKSETKKELLIVVKSLNKAPVIVPIADITLNEGETVTLDIKTSDSDGDDVTVVISGWMTENSKATGFDDAGTYTVTVKASDGKSESKQDVKVTVNNVNRAPIIKDINDITVTEGDKVSIATTSADPDGDSVTITYPSPFDSSGQWQTSEGDAGEKEYTIIASDGKLTDSISVKVIVQSSNKPPLLTLTSTSITVEETETVRIDASATDPEGKDVSITYSGWMTSATKTTGYDDAGTYKVTVSASDRVKTVSAEVTVTVKDKNRPPVIVI
ncbi:MAG: hypothetical protein V1740_01345 [Candidatus Woesearchaeota archaeon]